MVIKYHKENFENLTKIEKMESQIFNINEVQTDLKHRISKPIIPLKKSNFRAKQENQYTTVFHFIENQKKIYSCQKRLNENLTRVLDRCEMDRP